MQSSIRQVVNPSNYPSDYLSLKAYAITLAPEQERYPVGSLMHFQAQFAMRNVVYRLMKCQCPKGRDDDMVTFIKLFESSFPELHFSSEILQHTLCGCDARPVPLDAEVDVLVEQIDELMITQDPVYMPNDGGVLSDEMTPSLTASEASDGEDALMFGDVNIRDYEDPRYDEAAQVAVGQDVSSDETSSSSGSSDGTGCTLVTAVSPQGCTSSSASYIQDSILRAERVEDPLPMLKARKEIAISRGGTSLIYDSEDVTEIAVIYRSSGPNRYELRDEAREPILITSSLPSIHELDAVLSAYNYPKKLIWKIYFRLQQIIEAPAIVNPNLKIEDFGARHLQFISATNIEVNRMLGKLMW